MARSPWDSWRAKRKNHHALLALFRALPNPVVHGEVQLRLQRDRTREERLRGQAMHALWDVAARWIRTITQRQITLGVTGGRTVLFGEMDGSDRTFELAVVNSAGTLVVGDGWIPLGASTVHLAGIARDLQQAFSQDEATAAASAAMKADPRPRCRDEGAGEGPALVGGHGVRPLRDGGRRPVCGRRCSLGGFG